MGNKPFRIGYHKLTVYYRGPMVKPGAENEGYMMASFRFDTDMSPLFPYINAVAQQAEMHANPDLVRFYFQNIICVLYPDYCLISPILDRDHARNFVPDLVDYLNDIAGRMDQIKPKHKLFQKVSVLDILKLLPQNNCRECGFKTCMAFAATLSQQLTIPGRCPYMGLPVTEKVTYPVYDKDGNLQSTLTFDVDTAKVSDDLKTQTEYIATLESKIFSLSEKQIQESSDANAKLPQPLTDREIEVLRLIANGATNIEISHVLNISSHTVKSHVINIFNKLTVNDRTQAAVWAAQHKFI